MTEKEGNLKVWITMNTNYFKLYILFTIGRAFLPLSTQQASHFHVFNLSWLNFGGSNLRNYGNPSIKIFVGNLKLEYPAKLKICLVWKVRKSKNFGSAHPILRPATGISCFCLDFPEDKGNN